MTLIGRLTRDPEFSQTGNGVSLVRFSLAVERNYTNAQGERSTDFINCVAWRGLAETISKLTVKGSLVGITGRIQTGSYQNNEGRTVYTTDVVVDNFQILEPKSVTDQRRQDAGQSGGYSNNQYANPASGNNFGGNNFNHAQNGQNNVNNSPFSGATSFPNNPFEKNDDITDISDDDLPF